MDKGALRGTERYSRIQTDDNNFEQRERNTLQQEKNTQINADTTSEISMQEEEIQLHIFKA